LEDAVNKKQAERVLLWTMKQIDPEAAARYTADALLSAMYSAPKEETDVS
jgi:hypothetical protein